MKQHKQRFDTKYTVNSSNGCWEWKTERVKANDGKKVGYGHFYMDSKHFNAHRASWLIHKGPIGKDLEVCHRCDVTYCCNPEHLFLGSHRENVLDMYAKGRHKKLPKENNTKLTAAQVTEIKQYKRINADQTLSSIAKLYSVSTNTISNVLNEKHGYAKFK